jgi:hypothetical protein
MLFPLLEKLSTNNTAGLIMAKDIAGNEVRPGDKVAYIRKPWKGNQELRIGNVVSTSFKTIVVNEKAMWDPTELTEYRIKEGRFILYDKPSNKY